MTEDPYKTLGLINTSSLEEVKKKYRQLAMQCHPDRNRDDPKAADKFDAITKAYDYIAAGKYNPDDYKPRSTNQPSSSRRTQQSITTYTVETNMSSSFTGLTVSGILDDPVWVKPGFIGGETWTFTRKDGYRFNIYFRYRKQPDFFNVGHELHTTMTVKKKDVKKRTAFVVPNHPNPNAKKVIVHQDTKHNDSILVQGEGLPNDKGGYGNLHIKIIYSDQFTFSPMIFARLLWVIAFLFFVWNAFSRK